MKNVIGLKMIDLRLLYPQEYCVGCDDPVVEIYKQEGKESLRLKKGAGTVDIPTLRHRKAYFCNRPCGLKHIRARRWMGVLK